MAYRNGALAPGPGARPRLPAVTVLAAVALACSPAGTGGPGTPPPPGAPAITGQPQSQTVPAGQAATFSVTATGTAPLAYQWTRNGASISGATSASYTTPATAASDSGAQFRAVVSNPAGSVTSDPATLTVTTGAATVTVTLDPAHPRPISPWIYGINGLAGGSGNPPHLTLDRQGGNRLTAYNWENNASNAGSDWGPFSSDSFMSSSSVPAEAVRSFIAADRAIGAASLVTIQMQGYVAADESGLVDMSQPLATRLAARFKQVVPKKSTVTATPFTVSPPTTDAWVFMDELVWALDQKFAGQGIFGASPSLPTFVCLDNEPELWNSTHQEVQGTARETYADYLAKSKALTRALKDRFPDIVVFGPVHYGFGGLYDFQGEPGLGGATWFVDQYLKDMKAESDAYGKRLLDVYDFHWYSESYAGSTRVIDLSGPTLTDAEVQAVVQSPRSLWDPTFADGTDWISRDVLGGPIRILGRLQEKIDASYPGTRIAVTEYENGGWNHIAGTIAQADNLGIFGSRGVFAATFWPPYGTYDHALAGFRAFRGFDGGSAVFGDVSIPATSSDVSKVAVYASKDSSAAGRLVFVAINRSTAAQRVAISGQALSGTATTWRMTAASAAAQVAGGNHVAPVLVGQAPVSGTSMLVDLPALSVSTIAVQ